MYLLFLGIKDHPTLRKEFSDSIELKEIAPLRH